MISELLSGTMERIRSELPYLRKVEDLPSRDELLKNLEQLAGVTPCVYAIYEGGRFAAPNSTARRQSGDPVIILAVVTKSLRDSHGKSASGGQGGAYQILDDLRAALLGQCPAAGFGQLTLVGEALGALKNSVVCYLARYQAAYTITPQ